MVGVIRGVAVDGGVTVGSIDAVAVGVKVGVETTVGVGVAVGVVGKLVDVAVADGVG